MFRFWAVLLAAIGIADAVAAAPFSEARCYVDGFETPVRCVSITVPPDYAQPAGATIKLTAAIVPAMTAWPAPDPLFVFAGGPAQAATGMAPWLDSAFKPARRERDIVLFDVRGTGMSGAPDCPFSLTSDGDPVLSLKRDAATCAYSVDPRAPHFEHRRRRLKSQTMRQSGSIDANSVGDQDARWWQSRQYRFKPWFCRQLSPIVMVLSLSVAVSRLAICTELPTLLSLLSLLARHPEG